MGLTFQATATSANAPSVEPGEYDARFEGVEAKTLEKAQFDPDVFIWRFTLLDDDGKALYEEGEPIEVEKVTSQNTNVKSKTTPGAVKVLKALLTADEFETFEEGELVLKDDELVGRKVVLDVFTKESGWPGVEEIRRKATRPARKAKAE